MLRSFCDRCGSECEPRHSSSRRFESLAVTPDGQPMGFEVIPLFSGGSSSRFHVCDECMPELLEMVVETFGQSSYSAMKVSLEKKLEEHGKLERHLNEQLQAAINKEKMADDHLRGARDRVAVANAQATADAEKIRVLQAQVNALKHNIENR